MIERYDQAASDLEDALNQPDVGQYPEAAAACRRLIGYCRYFQGKFLDAKSSFVLATSLLRKPEAASEALWMAIVCLDKIVKVRPNDDLSSELALLMSRFLHEFPSSTYAPRITLKQALANDESSDEMVQTLLEIPENSDVYGASRRRATQALYQLYRDAKGPQKQAAAASGYCPTSGWFSASAT